MNRLLNAARFLCSSVAVLLLSWNGQASGQPPVQAAAQETDPVGSAVGYRVSGPFVHENLAVYLIHSDRRDDREFITLDEGLKRNLVVVSEKETAEVNELIIENRADKPCFIQEGDRLKGGKQDRIIYVSIVIKPRSGKVSLPSFCIEQGRWRQAAMGDEFSATLSAALSPKSVRVAGKIGKNQKEVWDEVAKTKDDYAKAFAIPSRTSSLNEAQDSPKIMAAAGQYQRTLESLPAPHPDVVGAAFAVNGKLEEASIYPGYPLFKKVFPRLLQSYAMEAALQMNLHKADEQPAPLAVQPPTSQQVLDFLKDSSGKSVRKENVNADNFLEVDDLGRRYRTITRFGDLVVHKQYLAH